MNSHMSPKSLNSSCFLVVQQLPLGPTTFFATTSKGKGSFASTMSLSTQVKLGMNFQVSPLMKYNPLYINNSNDINDSLTTTQIQKHCLSCLLAVCPKRLKNESFIESFISIFLLVLVQ
jgi:hypothetical protein